MLSLTNSQSDIYKNIMKLGNGIDPFIIMLTNENENVRLWSLKLIAKILQSSSSSQKTLLLADNRPLLIRKKLQKFPTTKETYYVLMELLLETGVSSAIENPIDSNHIQPFKNPEIIPTIFELMLKKTDLELQNQILSEFRHLLQDSDFNKSLFIDFQWQTWFFDLLTSYFKHHPERVNQLDETPSLSPAFKNTKSIYVVILDLFAILLHFSLWHPNSQIYSLQTETSLHYYSEIGSFANDIYIYDFNSIHWQGTLMLPSSIVL